MATANSPQIKLRADIADEINKCITKERFSMENINMSPKTPHLENVRESQHVKTCSESPNRWGPFKKKYQSDLRSSDMLTRDAEGNREGDNKTERSEAKSMYMKSSEYACTALFGASSPVKK